MKWQPLPRPIITLNKKTYLELTTCVSPKTLLKNALDAEEYTRQTFEQPRFKAS